MATSVPSERASSTSCRTAILRSAVPVAAIGCVAMRRRRARRCAADANCTRKSTTPRPARITRAIPRDGSSRSTPVPTGTPFAGRCTNVSGRVRYKRRAPTASSSGSSSSLGIVVVGRIAASKARSTRIIGYHSRGVAPIPSRTSSRRAGRAIFASTRSPTPSSGRVSPRRRNASPHTIDVPGWVAQW